MPNELTAFTTSGYTIYAILLNSIGQVYNGSTFVTIAAGNWTTYDIALTEGTAGIYLGNMPAVAAGVYSYAVYKQLGGSPAITDLLLGSGWIEWSGSEEVSQAEIMADTNELQTDWADSGRLDSILDSQLMYLGYISSDTAAINSRLPAIPAAEGSAMTLADDAITADKFDESTAFPLAQVDADGTAIARVGADADTLETLSDQMDGILTEIVDPLLNTVPGSYASGSAGYALGRIGSGQIETTSVVAESGDVETIQGDDYETADGRALDWTDMSVSWPTLTSAVITVVIGGVSSLTGSVVTATGDSKKVRLQLTGAQSLAIPIGKHIFVVKATLPGVGGNVITLVEGSWVSKKRLDA